VEKNAKRASLTVCKPCAYFVKKKKIKIRQKIYRNIIKFKHLLSWTGNKDLDFYPDEQIKRETLYYRFSC